MTLTRPTPELYGTYVDRMQKIADVKYSAAVLEWDQETYLPPKGAAARSRQLASLSEIAHEWQTAPALGDLMHELQQRGDLADDQRRNVELSLEDFNKQKKFSPAFVSRLSETSSRAFHSWLQARAANSFAIFKEDLQQLVDLKKEEAGLAGYEQHPYNALLDNFEKGCTTSLLDHVFHSVRSPLKDLLDRIANRPQVDDSFLHRHYPRNLQWEFGLGIIRQLGFDFEAGRQDLSEHPFTTSFSARDVRITTRIDENNFNHMTWSCIHETGHALYEQGLPPQYYGLPLGEFASLGIEHFYKAINKVTPSLIRTEADEVSYHFHVMIRYELEKRLIEGSLAVSDIPGWWKENYASWLGVNVPDDKNGCLQDVHWSHGSFGYFPTYSLGSFYAAQFFEYAASQDNIGKSLERGETAPLLEWLREHIHRHGRRFTSEQLCQNATGKGLDIRFFLDYLRNKYVIIYDFSG
ncbi:MAG TPA: carboxypeptidase M32 [Puia sp.]|nr:carboxypeptidase M32 [Puia sp.]